MDLTLFLTQVVGIYLVLIGLICIVKRKMMMQAMGDVVTNKSLLYVVAILELFAGVALVVGHNIWVWGAPVIITLVGWLMLIESLFYLALPYSWIKKIFRVFNTKGWYIGGGIACVLLGLYMVSIGFDLGLFNFIG